MVVGSGTTLLSPYESIKVIVEDPDSLSLPPGIIAVPCGTPGPWEEKCGKAQRYFTYRVNRLNSSVPGIPLKINGSLYIVGPGKNDDRTFNLQSLQLYQGDTPLAAPIDLASDIIYPSVHYAPILEQVIVLAKSAGNDHDGTPLLTIGLDGNPVYSTRLPHHHGLGASLVYGTHLFYIVNDDTSASGLASIYRVDLTQPNTQPYRIYTTQKGFIYPNLVINREGTEDFLLVPVLRNGAGGLVPSITKLRYGSFTYAYEVEYDELEIPGEFVNLANRAGVLSKFGQYRFLFDMKGTLGVIVFQGPNSLSKIAFTSKGLDSNWRVRDLADPNQEALAIRVRSLAIGPYAREASMIVEEDLAGTSRLCFYYLRNYYGTLYKECGSQ